MDAQLRPKRVHRLACLPQLGQHVLPTSSSGNLAWSCGMQSDLAPADGAFSSSLPSTLLQSW